jgi:hypothetical protein
MSTALANALDILSKPEIQDHPFEWLYNGQIWSCNECSTRRIWGIGRPADRKFDPLLGCENCGEPTRHHFSATGGSIARILIRQAMTGDHVTRKPAQ